MSKKFEPHIYDKQEMVDIEKFKEFYNNSTLLKKWFALTAETDSGWVYDGFAINNTGGTSCLEFKDRSPYFLTKEDCFIEPKKYHNLMRLYRGYRIVPVYINFFGDVIYIWLLPTVKQYHVYENIPIRGEIVDRYGLPWADAFKFEKVNGKWVKTQTPVIDVKPQAGYFRYLCPGCETPEDFLNNKVWKNYK